MSKILIISNSYPNYGGQSTTAYNLLKLLKQHGFDAKALYINDAKHSEIDPEKTGASHKIVLKKSLLQRVYQWLRRNRGISLNKQVSAARNYYFLMRLFPRLLYFQFSKKFSPELIITNIPSYYWLIRNIFSKQKVLLIIGSSPEMNKLCKQKIDAVSVIENPEIGLHALKNVYKPNYHNAFILFNSAITKTIYHKLQIKTGDAYVQYFNFAPYTPATVKPLAERATDIAFIASLYSRTIKNAPLAFDIFSAFPAADKLAVGNESEHFENIPNTTVSALTTQASIMAHLADTKVLLITSYFDSSPSVLSEAILSGCNVLVSKNVGWHDMLDERCVVQNYNDVNEWKEKAAYLMQHKIDYSRFEEVIASSTASIIANIQSVLDK